MHQSSRVRVSCLLRQSNSAVRQRKREVTLQLLRPGRNKSLWARLLLRTFASGMATFDLLLSDSLTPSNLRSYPPPPPILPSLPPFPLNKTPHLRSAALSPEAIAGVAWRMPTAREAMFRGTKTCPCSRCTLRPQPGVSQSRAARRFP